MAPAAVDLQEWIVNQFRVKVERGGKRADGCTVPDLVRNFRQHLRLGFSWPLRLAVEICCAMLVKHGNDEADLSSVWHQRCS